MPAAPADSQLARFLDCTLDLSSGELHQNGRRLLLPEQPFRILSLLIRQPGALVTREDLRRELWPEDTFVDFEHGLYHFSFRDGAFCPWVQRVDPVTKHPIGPPRAVLHLHDPRLRATSGATATSDVQAGYFYFTATEATGNIWMLDDGKS